MNPSSEARQVRSFVLIANPSAGKGRGESVLTVVEKTLRGEGCDVRTFRTTRRSDAVAYAAQSSTTDHLAVIAIGGDGTVHEVLNGLMTIDNAHRPILGVIPAGTGNDYARELGMVPRDPATAARSLVRAFTRRADVGCLEGATPRRLFFGVGVGFALMSAASAQFDRSLPLPARLAYFVGGVVALLTFDAPELSVTVDEMTQRGRFMIVHVGLCRTTGGGICLTPEAGLHTGRLHLSTVSKRGKLTGLVQWPWISRGRRLRGVNIVAGDRIRIKGERGMLIHVDGELQRVPSGIVEATLMSSELEILTVR